MEIKNTYKNKYVLVTGGTGFVGSHLVEELIQLGAYVVTTIHTTDRSSYFYTENLDTQVTIVPTDIRDFKQVRDLICKFDFSLIFHLAAQALVDVAYDNPLETLDTNIMGTANILEVTRLYKQSIQGIVFASSDKAYGKHGEVKYKEDDRLQGNHPYEVSKSAADLVATTYFKTYDVPIVTTRFGNIYGEGDLNTSRIIPSIMKSLVGNEVLEIRSNGKFIRDYLYVKDVVRGYLLLGENIEKVKGEAFNFGSSDTKSVLEVIEIAEKVLKKKIKYKILNIAKHEIPYQSLDYSKINKLTWSPNYNLQKTLLSIFQWYSQNL